jgi:hypothetical protein
MESYRTTDNKIDKAVVTLVDIDAKKGVPCKRDTEACEARLAAKVKDAA